MYYILEVEERRQPAVLNTGTLASMVVVDVASGVYGQTRDLFQAASLHTVLLRMVRLSGVNAPIESYTTNI